MRRSLTTLFFHIFCLSILILFCGTISPAAYGGTNIPRNIPTKGDTITQFRTKYSRIQDLSGKGSLSPDVLEKAKELHLEFEKYLIRSDGRINTLKLEIREFSGNEQEDAVNRLVKESGERERTLSEFLNQITHLTSIPSKKKEKKISKAIEEPSDPEKEALESSRDQNKKTSHPLEIEIKPQDMTSDKEELW